MAINYNVNPYYDDYDETKQFYRILFRPGRAVQARELTQIQTAIQKQIEYFGQSIYKEGSIVVPGGLSLDRKLPYANLTSSYGSNVSDTVVSSLVGETIIGQSSKVKGIVVNYQTSTSGGDPTTLYIRYTSSGLFANGVNTTFQAGETIQTTSGNMTLQIANTNPTGVGTEFAVTSGVVFVKGVFAYYDAQKYIVEKYNQANNAILGFDITESTVESVNDTSLLDPAVGASNYIAPGADRYKIALDLGKRPLTASANDDPNFVEMLRLEEGEIISKNENPEYSILGQTLARRTYDESGDYVVNPYSLQIINHLSTANGSYNGYKPASSGGDDNKIMNIISSGKAYVRGYEIQNLKTRYLVGDKARDFANVNNGIVSAPIGNFIYVTNVNCIPDLSILPTVTFYNQYNVTPATPNGTIVGTGRVRGIEFSSGTPGSSSAIYKLWLFDVNMIAGYIFERDVKQLYVDNSGYEDFTADISPTLVILTGSATLSNVTGNGSNSIIGTATSFNTELKNGDYVTIATQTFRVGNVVNAVAFTANSVATSNQTGIFAYLNTVVYNQTEDLTHVFEFPYSTIRSVDPTNLETVYDVRRSYFRTLSSNAVTISAGTDESFDGISTSSYILVIKSGTNAGQILNPTTYITRGTGGSSVVIDITSLANSPANVTAYSTADIAVVAKLTKTNTASDKKTKTLVANTSVTYIDANTAQASTISLGKADIYRLINVTMSNVSFGSAYSSSGEIDITSRYTLDNGQRPTFYDVGTISLKPNVQKPTGPIRISFDYFTHGTGDYFSVSSYTDIDYKNIPTFTHGAKTYQLRDSLDFRPRINDAGTGFSGTGAVVNDFLDPANDVITDYSYYLPRIDKISIDKNGNFKYTQGVSSLSPKEPRTPDDSMALFVLTQKPYIFNLSQDITVKTLDNRRYTMRDIGRIENRVKNLEYYTSLNLLEQNTQALQIQDSNGFDRFKNGFIVDNFSGHGVGDVYNRDYGVSIDYNNKELRPLVKTLNVPLTEINTSSGQRTANNYVINDGIVTLPYTHVEYIKNEKASKTENINPFDVITWIGKVTLDPPADIWFDEERLPTIERNEEGNYDQFLSEAQAKGTYGAIWGNWETVYYGSRRTDTRRGTLYEVVEQIDTRTDNDVVVSRSILPKMRNVNIKFTGEGLKPNTRIRVFFDNINVTQYCSKANTTPEPNATIAFATTAVRLNANNIVTDETGRVDGIFSYIANTFDLPTGEKSFRLTDSPTNGNDFETLADGVFNSSGELRYVRNEIVSVRNAVLNSKDILDERVTNINDNDGGGGGGGDTRPKDFLDVTFEYMFGRLPDGQGKQYWVNEGNAVAKTFGYDSLQQMVSSATVSSSAAYENGGINSSKITNSSSVGANDAAVGLFVLANAIGQGAINNSDATNQNGLMAQHQSTGGLSREKAAEEASKQIAYAIAGQNSGFTSLANAYWAPDAVAAATNTITAIPSNQIGNSNKDCVGNVRDPLAQTFFVDTSLFLTKVDLFFSAKDDNIPMRIQLRKLVNGSPGPYIIPLSEKYVYPSSINISDDGSQATTITFDAPVYLDAGEYALVLLADSINYRVFISQINETDIITGSLISKQPYVGVLFKSQNAVTWSADQYQDLKFTLYRASFDTTVTGIVEFKANTNSYQYEDLPIDPFEVYPNSNIIRVYHPKHGQNTGSSVRISGWKPTINVGSANNSTFYGMNVLTQLQNQPFTIDNTTLDSYTITLPQTVDANVTSILRTGGAGISIQKDHRYDTYYPVVSSLTLPGTTLTHRIKTTNAITYTIDTDFTTITVDNYNFNSSKTLASNLNRQLSMSNASPFIHRSEISTFTEFLSPVIDTKQLAGIFARNLINNPTYDSENKISANDIVTVANANNISVTQISGAEAKITFTNTQDKINAASIIPGTYVNISANNNVNNGQYRVIEVSDAGANVRVYNVSSQNVSTNATATYTITNGRNFIAEEAAFDGSAYSKYITRELLLQNSCTSFKFYLDVAKPNDASLKFYYKISEVGDTLDLTLKEYTEITSVTIPTSLDGTFNEVEKIVENLPAFDAIVFKIVFLGDDSSQIAKCKNLRVIALA